MENVNKKKISLQEIYPIIKEKIENGELNIRDAKFLPYHDLILLDGGMGHLNTISEIMGMMGNETPVFGMV